MYIYDPNTTFTSDPKVTFIGFLTWVCVWATGILFSDIPVVIPYLAPECITMVQCVTYIHDLCMTLTFGLNIKFYIFTMNLCLGKIVFALKCRHTKFFTWVLTMTQLVVYIHDLYDLDLWPTSGWRGYPYWVLLTVLSCLCFTLITILVLIVMPLSLKFTQFICQLSQRSIIRFHLQP